MGISFNLSDLEKGLAMFENKADVAVRMYAEQAALKMENYTKENKLWENRSGEAQRRLKGSVYPLSSGYRIKISHGVDYGLWLELAHEKKYAILGPTINALSPQVMKGFKNLIDKMK